MALQADCFAKKHYSRPFLPEPSNKPNSSKKDQFTFLKTNLKYLVFKTTHKSTKQKSGLDHMFPNPLFLAFRYFQ